MARRVDFGWLEPLRVFARSGTFAVAIFFVLSGFLLARPFWIALDAGHGLPGWRVYALRRAARVLPGYWLALTASYVCGIAILGAEGGSVSVLRYLAGFFLVSDTHWVTMFPVEFNAPLWSIAFEASSYLLLPVAMIAVGRGRAFAGTGWRLRLLWCGIIAVTMAIHWFVSAAISIDPEGSGWEHGLWGGAKVWMPYFNPFSLFAIFAVGALAAGVHLRWSHRRHWGFDVGAGVALAATFWLFVNLAFTKRMDGFAFLRIPYGFPAFPAAIALALALMPQTVMLGRLLDRPVVRHLATISFGIYLWHCLILELVLRYSSPTGQGGKFTEPREFAWFGVAVSALTLLVAAASYHLVERPVVSWARRLEGALALTPVPRREVAERLRTSVR